MIFSHVTENVKIKDVDISQIFLKIFILDQDFKYLASFFARCKVGKMMQSTVERHRDTVKWIIGVTGRRNKTRKVTKFQAKNARSGEWENSLPPPSLLLA